jgi:hypothetical protein
VKRAAFARRQQLTLADVAPHHLEAGAAGLLHDVAFGCAARRSGGGQVAAQTVAGEVACVVPERLDAPLHDEGDALRPHAGAGGRSPSGSCGGTPLAGRRRSGRARHAGRGLGTRLRMIAVRQADDSAGAVLVGLGPVIDTRVACPPVVVCVGSYDLRAMRGSLSSCPETLSRSNVRVGSRDAQIWRMWHSDNSRDRSRRLKTPPSAGHHPEPCLAQPC